MQDHPDPVPVARAAAEPGTETIDLQALDMQALDLQALDLQALAEMETLLGRPRLTGLLTDFHADIVRLLLPDELGSDTLSRNAHALAGASGTLGFTALSRACAAVEEGCRSQGDLDGLRRTAREAGRSALESLALVAARLA